MGAPLKKSHVWSLYPPFLCWGGEAQRIGFVRRVLTAEEETDLVWTFRMPFNPPVDAIIFLKDDCFIMLFFYLANWFRQVFGEAGHTFSK